MYAEKFQTDFIKFQEKKNVLNFAHHTKMRFLEIQKPDSEASRQFFFGQ
jgi:hypothetical protein